MSPALGVGADQVAEAGIAGMIAGRRAAAPSLLSQVGTLAARTTPGADLLATLHRWL